jgi:Protein of unknown function (DUF3102)
MANSIIVNDATLRQHADDIRKLIRSSANHIQKGIEDYFESGRLLALSKKIVGHGKWSKWLEDEFELSETTAQRRMRAHEFFVKNGTVPDLSLKSLNLITARSTSNEASEEVTTRAKRGEKMTPKKIREVKARKPKDQKLKKIQSPAKAATTATKSTTAATESKSDSKPESKPKEETRQESTFSITGPCTELFKLSAIDAASAMLYSTSGAVEIANAILEKFATFPPASPIVPEPMWNDAVVVSVDSDPVTLELKAEPVTDLELPASLRRIARTVVDDAVVSPPRCPNPRPRKPLRRPRMRASHGIKWRIGFGWVTQQTLTTHMH